MPRGTPKAKPMTQQADTPSLVERLQDEAATLSDAELGIGEEDAADPLAALLADPTSAGKLAALIDAAVEARIARMAPSAPMGEGTEAFKAFLASIEKMLEMNAIQQPGYQKPMPPAELERRAAGYVEMTALLRGFREARTPPHYYVGENLFYTDCELIPAGEPVATYLPPVEDFEPINDEARQVMAAFRQWIGGATPGIGDQLAAAMAERRAGPRLVGEGLADAVKDPAKSGAVRLDNVKRKEIVRPPAFAHMGETVMPAPGARPAERNQAAEPQVGPVFA